MWDLGECVGDYFKIRSMNSASVDKQKLQSKHNQLDKVKGEALCRKVKVHEGRAKDFVLKEKQFVERSRFEIERKELKSKEE